MKNYDEMANDVFRRVEKYNADKRRKRKTMLCALVPACCIAVLIGVLGWQGGLFASDPAQTLNDAVVPGIKDWYGPGETEPIPSETGGSDNIPAVEPFVYLCSVKSAGEVVSELILPQQSYDSKICLGFVSFAGFTEDRITEEIHKYMDEMETAIAQYENYSSVMWSCKPLRNAGYMVTKIALNSFALDLDMDRVKRITVTNTCDFGQIDVFGVIGSTVAHGQEIILEKEQLNDNLSFSWNYTRIADYFKKTESPSYSDFDDTFNFVVEYQDGTKATASIEIRFNEAGEAIIGCGGYERIPM